MSQYMAAVLTAGLIVVAWAVPSWAQAGPQNAAGKETGYSSAAGTPPTSGATTSDTSQAAKLLQKQDIYVVKNPEGTATSVYSVPSGKQLSPEIFSDLPAGSSIIKLAPEAFSLDLLPSHEQIANALAKLLIEAKRDVCGMPERPATFGASVDVQAGVGMILTAQWDTATLCNK